MRHDVDHELVSIATQRELFEIMIKFSKSILHDRLVSPNSKIKNLLAIGILVAQAAVIFFLSSALANEISIIHYETGLNYFQKFEAGPINLITDFYEDNYRQFYSHAIRFYYKSTADNTLHEIKSFTDIGLTSKIDIYNSSGPDCEFSLARLVHKGDDLILVFFTRRFKPELTFAMPDTLDILLFRLTKEESPLDASQYYFKKYENLTSKKAMCTSDEIDSYLRSNLSKLVH